MTSFEEISEKIASDCPISSSHSMMEYGFFRHYCTACGMST